MNLRTSLTVLLLGFSIAAQAAAPQHWVGTWATSPVPAVNKSGKLGAGDPTGTTYREIVHISVGGPGVRIILTNEFGSEPLIVGAASIGVRTTESTVGAHQALTFGGKPTIIIPAGALAVSDPATLKVSGTSDLAVSLFFPEQTVSQISRHNFADQTSYATTGNQVAVTTLQDAKTTSAWDFLKGVDVTATSGSASIVCLGDSITDGALSTRDANARWPDILAKRLQANKATANLGVLNQGIGGNRVLHDNTGPNALARFERDVLSQTGVKYLIFLEGINDIGHAYDPGKPYDVITAEDLIAGFRQMILRAHDKGIRVYGATLTPYGGKSANEGAKYSSPDGEKVRTAVNEWIRTSKELDGFIDFDKATRDPNAPAAFADAADSPDHLHPRDAGYRLMGDSIDLKLFTK